MIRYRLLSGAVLVGTLFAGSSSHAENGLRGVDTFDRIEDEKARSVALFEEMAQVLTHPRCMNCHPKDDNPRQGEDMVLHQPPVVRGAGGLGAPGMRCSTCHGAGNIAYVASDGSLPGHVPWQLAPPSMGWVGASVSEICEQIKDPERNGGKSLAQLQEHNANDGLVGWGWNPGEGRESAPGTQALFGELTQAWIDTGAVCPEG